MCAQRFAQVLFGALLLNALGLTFDLALPMHAAPRANVTITVDTTADSNALTTCSAATPNDCSLRGAITKANGDSSNAYAIVLPAGTYLLTLAGAAEGNNATGDLDIKASLIISGAGAGVTTINGNNLDRVLDNIGATNVSIADVTITGGNAPAGAVGAPGGPGGAGHPGGAIRNTETLTLMDSIVTGNTAGNGGAGGPMPAAPLPGGAGGNGGDGGGIYNSGTLTLTNTTVSGNNAGGGGTGGAAGVAAGIPGGNGGSGGNGGGIYNTSTTALNSSTISGNNTGTGGAGGTGSAAGAAPPGPGGPGGAGGTGGNGGGIYNGGTLTLDQGVVRANNTGSGGAAGVAGAASAPVPSLVSFPAGNGGAGGGIYNAATAAAATLDNSTISTNTTGMGGAGGTGGAGCAAPPGLGGPGGSGGNGGNGGAISNSSTLTVTNTTLSGDTTGAGGAGGTGGAGGGGIAPGGNGGVGGNGGDGGGVYNTGTTTLNNATVASNQTGTWGVPGAGGIPAGGPGAPGGKGDGGGILQSAGIVNVKNTLVANNIGSQDNDCRGTLTSQRYNLIGFVSANCTIAGDATGNITGQNPKLLALGNYGGPTQTHALQNDSPALDAANPAAPGSGGNACDAKDQRGRPRADLRCDIGAFELQFSDNSTVQKCNLAAGTYTFGPTFVQMDITMLGTLTCLSVQRVDANHPNAGTHFQTGKYWTITPTGIGYTVNLTLPHNLADHTIGLVGRYTGTGQVWDYARTSSTATTITRNGIAQLSDWAVGSNTPPALTSVSKTGYVNTDLLFAAADWGACFADADGDALSKIKVTSLPADGTVKLSGAPIAVNQEIDAANLGNLAFTPNSGWTGTTTFGWNGYDGMTYAASGASVNITITLRSLQLPLVLR